MRAETTPTPSRSVLLSIVLVPERSYSAVGCGAAASGTTTTAVP